MEKPKSPSSADLGKIAHELANHLFVLTMAVDLLEASRDDPERFGQALQSLRSHGLEPLSDLLSPA